MKKNTAMMVSLFMFLTTMQSVEAQQQAYQDDDLTPEAFSLILKEEWGYLHEATDQLDKETGIRGEFETTPEFQSRAAQARQTSLDKLNGHIKDVKLDRRVLSVWFKAILESYDADVETYSVKCPTTIEAPYDIVTVECFVPPNQYLEMADSIQGGYRRSTIRFKFDPDFKWTVARSEAMAAKGNESTIFFRVNFIVNMTLENLPTKALLKIIPKSISLVNKVNKYIYWKEAIEREEVEY
jgi:hypothetical protein